ncbi:hypothetical protein [Nocardia sp. NPDC046763]|uniref:hypothetical protein n=1 Tax=Nocardia sp. NPDC046763 TaxID=3155256 RepID=UPI0034002603
MSYTVTTDTNEQDVHDKAMMFGWTLGIRAALLCLRPTLLGKTLGMDEYAADLAASYMLERRETPATAPHP